MRCDAFLMSDAFLICRRGRKGRLVPLRLTPSHQLSIYPPIHADEDELDLCEVVMELLPEGQPEEPGAWDEKRSKSSKSISAPQPQGERFLLRLDQLEAQLQLTELVEKAKAEHQKSSQSSPALKEPAPEIGQRQLDVVMAALDEKLKGSSFRGLCARDDAIASSVYPPVPRQIERKP